MTVKRFIEGSDPVADLGRFFAKPTADVFLKQKPEDFIVTEELGFDLTKSGEHVFLRIQKIGSNTDYIAREIAKLCGLPRRDVSYSGMKDRHGITSQWFSVWLRNKPEPDWQKLCSDNLSILESGRHKSKLRRGSHKRNSFEILLRNFSAGDDSKQDLEQRLETVKSEGVPNYFGNQRFGYHGKNISDGLKFLNNEMGKVSKSMRGIYISAIRSWVFNELLSQRVNAGNWNKCISGDVLQLDGTGSLFSSEGEDILDINNRIASGDLHPTGILPGKLTRHTVNTTAQAAHIEQSIFETFGEYIDQLIALDLEVDRRSLRLPVIDLAWKWSADDELKLFFTLIKGGFATSVLRELLNTVDQSFPGKRVYKT